ncbi:hypothetical protein LTR37_009214 [Vermiconidia calcicola]|uniref:Uncharacterized protein n=1 Tax=Vermiconidia calcicola TaxID=1690605 RepID=A0ACC3N8F1_9PEZI|nr:hypothetical protein LTR37_009214 [Vermiconidia calcicola]
MGIVLSLLSRQESKGEKLVKQALGNDETLYAFPDESFYAYDRAKLYNLDIPTRPAAVTYPKTPEQISALVEVARDAGLVVQAKSGGHSYCNFSSPDGGIVVDLRNFKKFSMDTETWQAKALGGILLGELTEAMYNPHKRAMAHGGYIFWMESSSTFRVQVVVSDGRILQASESQNADLFWALKGAGASFGIITEFVLRTEPAPGDTVQYKYSFTTGSWGEMTAVFKSWQRFIADPKLPREFATTATITALGLTVSRTFCGSEAEFEQLSLKPDFPLRHTGEKTVVSQIWIDVLTHQAEEVALKLGGGISAHAYTKTLPFGGSEQNSIAEQTVDKLFDHI